MVVRSRQYIVRLELLELVVECEQHSSSLHYTNTIIKEPEDYEQITGDCEEMTVHIQTELRWSTH